MYFPLSAITIGQVNMNMYPSVDECISVYINMYSSVYSCLLSAYDVCMYVRSYLYIYIYMHICVYIGYFPLSAITIGQVLMDIYIYI
jgi:hypothetical protein